MDAWFISTDGVVNKCTNLKKRKRTKLKSLYVGTKKIIIFFKKPIKHDFITYKKESV